MATYEIDLKNLPDTVVNFEFTPTLENAPSLLMDIAALLEKVSNLQEQPQPINNEKVEKLLSEAQQTIQRLQFEKTTYLRRIAALEFELNKFNKNSPTLKATPSSEEEFENAAPIKKKRESTCPKIGERVKIGPHDEYKGWTNGIIKGFQGRGAAYVIVLPKNHGHTITIPRHIIKRFKAEELKEEETETFFNTEFGIKVDSPTS